MLPTRASAPTLGPRGDCDVSARHRSDVRVEIDDAESDDTCTDPRLWNAPSTNQALEGAFADREVSSGILVSEKAGAGHVDYKISERRSPALQQRHHVASLDCKVTSHT